MGDKYFWFCASVPFRASVSPATISLLVGGTAQLTATARDQNGAVMTGQTFAWTSGSGTIAIVSATGVVTAMD